MARLTIEDKWWTDPRRSKLIKIMGGEDEADLAALRLWKLAQLFWGNGKRRIPLDLFEILEASSKLVEAKLAFVEDGEVYAKGSGEYLSWLHEKRLSASEGGKKSAEARRKKNGTAQPKPSKPLKTSKQTRSTPEANSNTLEPSGSGSGSDLDSGSNSYLGSSAFFTENRSAPPASLAVNDENKGQFLLAKYCEAFKAKHSSNPDITGKDGGIAKRLAQPLSRERIQNLIAAYFAMPDAGVIKARHPLEFFEMKLKEIGVFADSGAFVTRTQAHQADAMAGNAILLNQVRAGAR